MLVYQLMKKKICSFSRGEVTEEEKTLLPKSKQDDFWSTKLYFIEFHIFHIEKQVALVPHTPSSILTTQITPQEMKLITIQHHL